MKFTWVFVGSLVFSLTVHAAPLPKKVKAAKEIAAAEAPEDAPIAAKLVVDSAGVAEAIAAARAENGSLSLPTETATEEQTPVLESKEPPAKIEVTKLPESQIPVLTGTKEAKKNTTTNFTRILTTAGVFILVLGALSFWLRRVAAGRTKKNQNTKIKVLTQHALGPKKSLAIIQVAGEAILVGITDHNISMLKTLSLIDDEFPEEIPRNFDSAMTDYDGEEEIQATRSSRRQPAVEQDEFAMRGLNEIRDKVSTRLRNMKNL